MLLRTIIGTDMPDGMRRMREQLGDDAIIVQVEELQGGGVLLLAATDGSRPPAIAASAATRPSEPRSKPAIQAPAAAMPLERILDRIGEALSFHRVPPHVSERLIEAVEGGDWRGPADALAAALGTALGFTAAPAQPRTAPILLVGAPGAGKTVTVAKLAAEAVLAGRRAGIVSADTGRAGGLTQIAAFAEALGIDVLEAATPRDLQDALIAAGGCEAVFVDTPAAAPFAPEEIAATVGLARAAGAEIVPVLAAGGDPVESAEAAAVWREAGAVRCIVSRVDAVRRLGGLIATAAAGLPVSHLGTSRAIAHGLTPATPERVAEAILAPPRGAAPPSTPSRRSVR